MNTTQFQAAMTFLMKSKGRKLDEEILIVWYKLLVEQKRYTADMINFACEQLIFSDNQFPTVNDFVKILNPQQDIMILADKYLEEISTQTYNERPPQIFYDSLHKLTNDNTEYISLQGEKRRWFRKEYIEILKCELKEQKRIEQVASINKLMIGDGK